MKYKIIIPVLVLFLFLSCVKTFLPNFKSPTTGYLVVEGWINSGLGSTTLALSRSTPLNDTLVPPPELGATVTVEGSDGTHFNLSDQRNGTYFNAQLNLNYNSQYRLHIITTNGKEYFSDYQSAIKTSPIDSLGWVKNSSGIGISLYTHNNAGPQNYHIAYSQTYEIVSQAYSKYIFLPLTDTILPRDPNQIPQLYTCWNTIPSDSILIASTSALKAPYPLIYKLVQIPNGSLPLSVEYSIEAEEYAISNSANTFFQSLKTSSEPSSSLFNPLPSQAQGNIHNSKDASETVLGYVGIADVNRKRIFIKNSQVLPWLYNPSCPVFTKNYLRPGSKTDIKTKTINDTTFNSVDIIDTSGNKFTFQTEPIACIDCRTYGSPIKPSFWP